MNNNNNDFGWTKELGYDIIESVYTETEKTIYYCEKCLSEINLLCTQSTVPKHWKCSHIDVNSGETCNSTKFTKKIEIIKEYLVHPEFASIWRELQYAPQKK